jgi:hypothetical protein
LGLEKKNKPAKSEVVTVRRLFDPQYRFAGPEISL